MHESWVGCTRRERHTGQSIEIGMGLRWMGIGIGMGMGMEMGMGMGMGMGIDVTLLVVMFKRIDCMLLDKDGVGLEDEAAEMISIPSSLSFVGVSDKDGVGLAFS